MGNCYANIVLKGVSQQKVVDYLTTAGRDAYISPTVNNFTVVYDAEIYSPDQLQLVRLATELSESFNCPALAIFNYDDSILWYRLLAAGVWVDEYISQGDENWQPGKIITEINLSKCQPRGGDGRKLLNILGGQAEISQLESILRSNWKLEINRHEALSRGLGMSSCWTVGMDYRSIVGNNLELFFKLSNDDFTIQEVLSRMQKTQFEKISAFDLNQFFQ